MKIKLIIIGNELLYGRTADKNGLWLGSFLDERGLELSKIVTIKDELIATGRCLLNKNEMFYFNFGMAAKTRDHL